MIEFENVSFSYRAPAEAAASGAGVRNVDLSIEAGTCVLVCGPSGCGKTTLTRLANGLAPSFFSGKLDGRVLIDGTDCADMESWEVAERVGSVFQNPRTQFFNVDSTGEVAFSLESMAWPEEAIRARTHDTIDELGLSHLADRSIFSLSGGEKQRIAYASVWASHPGTLVLDEPTSNLDMEAIADLRAYLLDAKEKGTAILVAEHRLWWLADVVDAVVLMESGRIIRTMSADAFRALSTEERGQMGLRTGDLADVRARSTSSDHSPGPASELLSMSGVRAAHGKREVLRGIDFTMYAGQVVALVGRNGAGKSTLCRTLCGLHRESGGSLRLSGHPTAPKDRLHRCSMVFQEVNYQLFADSVAAEVTFGLEGSSAPSEERVDEILEDMGLAAYAQRHPATLSGGQKQRLAVAACIAADTSILVFDEPTSGLDLRSMQRVADFVRELASGGHAIVAVTHDLEFIACACDRAVLLFDGRLERETAVTGDLSCVRDMLVHR